jgi:hypothetical protein
MKGINKISLRGGAIANTIEVRGFVYPNDISEVEDLECIYGYIYIVVYIVFNYILTKKFNFP